MNWSNCWFFGIDSIAKSKMSFSISSVILSSNQKSIIDFTVLFVTTFPLISCEFWTPTRHGMPVISSLEEPDAEK